MGKLFGLTVALLVLGLLFEGLEGWAWSVPRLRTRWRTDLLWFFFGALIADPILQVAMVLTLALPAVALGIAGPDLPEGRGPLAALPFLVQVPLALLVGDLVGYWMHRLHHRTGLWKTHAVHHSSEHLDWLAAVRVHPLNELVQRAPGALLLVLMGFDLTAIAAVAPVVALYAVLQHANVPWRFGWLRFLVTTPAFHRWHHASAGTPAAGCNFGGLFPLWDLLFGTYFVPAHAPQTFGVVGDPLPEGFLGQLVYPLRGRSRAARSQPPRSAAAS